MKRHRQSVPEVLTVLLLLAPPIWHLAECRVTDPYSVLGLQKGCTEEQVKRAYRKLALKYHPDKNRDNKKATAKFLEVQEAYDILTSPEKRHAHDSGWADDGSAGGGRRSHQQHHYYRQQGSWRFQWPPREDDSYDRVLPSSTTMITSSNIANNVLYSLMPWLVLVYAEDSPACRRFARVWEELAKVVASSKEASAQQQPWFNMGRINWRHQRQLAYWVANARVTGGDFEWSSLPIVYAVRPECAQSECFIRHWGPMTMSGLQDFVADKLMEWPSIPQVDLSNLDVLLGRVHPAKVVALAFSKSAGQGSLQLRHLASEQDDMMAFARISLAPTQPSMEDEAGEVSSRAMERLLEQWSRKLGVTGLKPSTLVLLRGPGTEPQVLHVRAADLAATIHEQTLMWQVIPALRPHTLGPLGCHWGAAGGAAFFMGDQLTGAKLCVVVMAHTRQVLDAARANMLHLSNYLHQPHRHPALWRGQLQGLANLVVLGQVRLTWLDSSVQTSFCRHHVHAWAAEQGDSGHVNQPGSYGNGAWDGADNQHWQGVSAAICGRSWQQWGVSDLPAAAQAVVQGRVRQAVGKLRPPPPRAALLAYRPTLPGSARVESHVFSLLTDVNIGSHDLGSAGEASTELLGQVAAWLASCLAASNSGGARSAGPMVKSSRGPPPPLVPDDEPGAMEFVTDRLIHGIRVVVELMSTCFGPGGMGPQLQQLLGLVSTLLVLLIVHLAMRTNEVQRQQREQPPAADSRYEGMATSSMGGSNPGTAAGMSHRVRGEGISNGGAYAGT